MDDITQPLTTPKPSVVSRYKFTIISLVIILLAAVPLLVFSNKKPTAPSQPVAVSPSPTVAPLTSQTAQQELDQNDQDMQQTLNQVDVDLQAASQVDSTQDSTSGL